MKWPVAYHIVWNAIEFRFKAQHKLARFCGAVLMVLAQLNGETSPSVQEVLAKVAEKYRAPRRYLLRATAIMEDAERTFGSQPIPITVAVEHPDKMRLEGEFGALGLRGFDMWVCDGEASWAHNRATKLFYKIPRTSGKGSVCRYDGGRPDVSCLEQVVAYVDSFVFIRYRGDMRPAGAAKLAGKQKIPIHAGKEVECYIVHIDRGAFDDKKAYASRNTWWVDQDSYVVWKEENTVWHPNGSRGFTSTMFNAVSLEEPLPKDVFVFVPPPGSTLGELPSR